MTIKKPNLVFRKIKSISELPFYTNATKVYNLKCNPYPNFFSNFILVHNCDTTWTIVNRPYCKVERNKGKGIAKIKNPLSSKKLFTIIKRFNRTKGPYHSVSLTGGEPLLQKDFLKEFLPMLKQQMNINIYLETNGILFKELKQVVDHIDIIAMDFKLPSSTGLRDFWDEHRKFLEIASRKKVFIKAVISNSTELKDLNKAVALITNTNRNFPFVLQPDSSAISKQLMAKLKYFQYVCLNSLSDVRIIPQIHKLLGVK